MNITAKVSDDYEATDNGLKIVFISGDLDATKEGQWGPEFTNDGSKESNFGNKDFVFSTEFTTMKKVPGWGLIGSFDITKVNGIRLYCQKDKGTIWISDISVATN